MPLAIRSILANSGIDIKVADLATSQPSGQSIKGLLKKRGKCFITQKSIQHIPNISISADKGDKKRE